jgi:hypothetical protein
MATVQPGIAPPILRQAEEDRRGFRFTGVRSQFAKARY